MSSVPATVSPAPAPTFQTQLRIVRGDSIKPKAIPWLWPGYMPLGKTITLTGLPGQGKSLATCSLIAAVTAGKDFPDGTKNPEPPGEVLILSTEDDADCVLIPRLTVAGADVSKVYILQSTLAGVPDKMEERQVALDQDCKLIHRMLAEHQGIRLFIIDPITNHTGAKSNVKEEEVRQLLRPLEKSGVTNVIVTHLNKQGNLGAMQRVMGAAAFVGLARAAYIFADEQNGNHHMLVLKNNYGHPKGLRYAIETEPLNISGATVDVPRIKWLGKSDADADSLLDVKTKLNARKAASAKDEAEAFLKRCLVNGEKPALDCINEAAEESISESTLRRAAGKDGLSVVKRKDGGDGPWLWSLRKPFIHQPE